MKNKNNIPFFLTCGMIAGSLLISQAIAGSGNWVNTGVSGNWKDAAMWQGGNIADGVDAVAGLTSPTSPGRPVVTLLSGEVWTVGTLESFAIPPNRSYTVEGPGTLNFQVSAGVPKLTVRTGTAGPNLTFNAAVSGNQGLRVEGTNNATQVTWNPSAMGLTGGITLAGAGFHIFNATSLGSNIVTLEERVEGLNRYSSMLGFEEATTLSNGIQLNGSGNGLRYSRSGSTTLTTINVTGAISELVAGSELLYTTDTGAGNGHFKVSGNNSYTGDTIIGGTAAGGVVVEAAHNHALGTGVGSKVRFETAKTALRLSGGITISDKQLILNGLGYSDLGSLNSISGQNTWKGKVVLGATGENRIRVNADTLTMEGEISGSEILGKTGAGILELAAANTHTGKTLVQEGKLRISHDEALIASITEVRSGSAIEVASGTRAEIAGLQLQGGAQLVFDLDGFNATGMEITGDLLSLNGGVFDIIINDSGLSSMGTYTLLTIGGDWSGVSLSSFHLMMDPGYSGSYLAWEGGTLTLTTIPEGSTVTLVLAGAAALFVMRRRRAIAKAAV